MELAKCNAGGRSHESPVDRQQIILPRPAQSVPVQLAAILEPASFATGLPPIRPFRQTHFIPALSSNHVKTSQPEHHSLVPGEVSQPIIVDTKTASNKAAQKRRRGAANSQRHRESRNHIKEEHNALLAQYRAVEADNRDLIAENLALQKQRNGLSRMITELATKVEVLESENYYLNARTFHWGGEGHWEGMVRRWQEEILIQVCQT